MNFLQSSLCLFSPGKPLCFQTLHPAAYTRRWPWRDGIPSFTSSGRIRGRTATTLPDLANGSASPPITYRPLPDTDKAVLRAFKKWMKKQRPLRFIHLQHIL